MGSALHDTFLGLVDWTNNPTGNNIGVARPGTPFPPAGVVTHTVEGLDPAQKYVLQGGATRGDVNYEDRWTLFELAGADGFVSAHHGGLTSTQVPADVAANQIAINTGARTGDMFEWQEVNPGSDGRIQIISKVYTGSVPGGSSGGNGAYALTALKIQEAFPTAPVIITHPQSRLALLGESVMFQVRATGYPLQFQWFRDDEPIPGATSIIYVLPEVSEQDDGAVFHVAVSNALGTAISDPAELSVQREFTVGEALNNTNLIWTLREGWPLWFPQTAITHDGEAALQSGTFSRPGELTEVSTTVEGPGTLSFWWKMQSPNEISTATFRLDGRIEERLMGDVDWQYHRFYLTSNLHTLAWSTWINSAPASDGVTSWLDEVFYQPGGDPPEIVTATTNLTVQAGQVATFRVEADGRPPFRYQWHFEGLEIAGATAPFYSVQNAQSDHAGTYTVIVANDFGATPASALLTVNQSEPTFLTQRTNLFTVAGGEAWLQAMHFGSEPISYQWRFEDTVIPEATNQVLKLYDVSTNHIGRYSVVASNALGLAVSPCFHLGLTEVRRVIHISADGLGGRHLAFALQYDPTRFPAFLQLRREGSFTFNARCDYFISLTVPNHLSMITGRPVLQPAGQEETVHHGFTENYPPAGSTVHLDGNPVVPYKASVFDVAHDRGLRTACLISKSSMTVCTTSYDPTNGAPDTIPPDHGRNKIDHVLVDSSASLVDAILAFLAGDDPPHYTFLHLADMDYAGHSLDWGSPAWFDVLTEVDSQLGRLVSAIVTNPNPAIAEQTVVILTADHGGGTPPDGHAMESEPLTYTVPLFAWGPGFPAGADLYSRFANRADPGTNWLNYDTIWPPLWNGDSGNLALQCLGLPPIPGSTLIPLFPSDQASLTIRHTDNDVQVSWPTAAAEFILESAPILSAPPSWVPLTNGIQTNSLHYSHRHSQENQPRFFRLKKSIGL